MSTTLYAKSLLNVYTKYLHLLPESRWLTPVDIRQRFEENIYLARWIYIFNPREKADTYTSRTDKSIWENHLLWFCTEDTAVYRLRRASISNYEYFDTKRLTEITFRYKSLGPQHYSSTASLRVGPSSLIVLVDKI